MNINLINIISLYSGDIKLKPFLNKYKIYFNKHLLLQNPNVIPFIKNKIDIFDKTDWIYFSQNKCAIDILKENKDKINWLSLCSNESAYYDDGIIIEELEKTNWESKLIDWTLICLNNNSYNILNKLLIREGISSNKFKWNYIFGNKSAGKLIKEYIDTKGINSKKINWYKLCSNPDAIDIIYHIIKTEGINSNKIKWEYLSKNSAAIDLLYENQSKINWHNLSKNTNAFDLLYENQSKINWSILCSNPVSLKNSLLLEEYINNKIYINKKIGIISSKINWNNLSKNNNIFYIEKNKNIKKIFKML